MRWLSSSARMPSNMPAGSPGAGPGRPLLPAAVGPGYGQGLAAHGVGAASRRPAFRFRSPARRCLNWLPSGWLAARRHLPRRRRARTAGRYPAPARRRASIASPVTGAPAPHGVVPLLAAWRAGQLDALTVSSSEGCATWSICSMARAGFPAETPVFVPHARIAENARALGLKQHSADRRRRRRHSRRSLLIIGRNDNPARYPPERRTAAPAPRRRSESPGADCWLRCRWRPALAGWQWFETRQKLNDLQQEVSRANPERVRYRQQGRAWAQKQTREQIEALQAKTGRLRRPLQRISGSDRGAQGAQPGYRTPAAEVATARSRAGRHAGRSAIATGRQRTGCRARPADRRCPPGPPRPAGQPLAQGAGRRSGAPERPPFVDMPGISLRLEQLILGHRQTAADGRRPRPPSTRLKAQKRPPTRRRGGKVRPGDVWQELKGLVRIQRFDREDRRCWRQARADPARKPQAAPAQRPSGAVLARPMDLSQ